MQSLQSAIYNNMSSIRNLMDNEFANKVLDNFPDNDEEFILSYLKLDPDFTKVLTSEFSIDPYDLV